MRSAYPGITRWRRLRRSIQAPAADASPAFERVLATAALLVLAILACNVSPAEAAVPAPGWSIQAKAQPTSFARSDCAGVSAGYECDHYTLIVSNVGGAASQGTVTVTDQVPAGLAITPGFLQGTDLESEEPLSCTAAAQLVTCIYENSVPAGDILEVVVGVEVEPGTPAGALAPDTASVEGGGAPAQSTDASTLVEVPQPFGLSEFGLAPYAADGTLDPQAGDHPYAFGSRFGFNSVLVPAEPGTLETRLAPTEDPKSAFVYLPSGMVGNPTALPQCPLSVLQLNPRSCPASSRLGVVGVETEEPHLRTSFDPLRQVTALYNVQPEHGYPAEFGFEFFEKLVTVYASLVHVGGKGGGYALRVGSAGIPAARQYRVRSVLLSFFGNPAERNGGSTPAAAFLTNPTNCASGPLNARIETNSWQNPARWISEEQTVYPAVSGCEKLRFEPTLQLKPEVLQADTPSGYEVDLRIPQAPNVAPSLATPDLRDARVTLPRGVVLSASAANGLAGCKATGPEGINIGSSEIGLAGQDLGDPEATELGAGHPGGNASPYDDGVYHIAPGHCPAASQIGELEISTPLLTEPLHGHVYVAQPTCGGPGRAPCTAIDAINGNLYGIYLEAAGSGVIVKLHGDVAANPQTGQLTATFSENPQLPFEEFRLKFDGGPLAPLANPQLCGNYLTTTDLTPWSTPQTPDATPKSSFAIRSGAAGSACPAGEAGEPNRLAFEAGTQTALAASYSPFLLKLSREDGTQRLGALNLTLPPGLTGRLAGVPYCPDGAIAAAGRNSGGSERAGPSCPSASEVGTVTVGAGPGEQPFYVQGRVYLAGPYRGAPLSLAIITPAVAGPFDLGTVVVRSALYVDPTTAQISVRSDPIPSILDGTPLDIRSVAIKIDRPSFTLNPTNCEEMAVTGEAISTLGNPAALRNRFQAAGCRELRFKPKLALRVFGKTNRNAKPRFRAVLQTKPGEANIARAQVNLPHSEFLEQAHIKTICTRVQFNAGAGHGEQCPKGSIYGQARAYTPLLDQPLQGPVYLRSSNHKLPDLVAALNGQIDIALAGKVDSGPNAGIRNTFEVVPDAPVSKFILEMKGGKRGLLVNSENLCSKQAKATGIARFTGQNGKVETFKPKVANSCPTHRKPSKRNR